MENASYAALTRQSGLVREMQSIANNLANMSTTGYRKEGVIFSEYISNLDEIGGSLSSATANVRHTENSQGPIVQTGGSFDFAIEGDGFLMIESEIGPRMTRAGSFSPNANGELSTPDGFRLLDEGGTPIIVPPNSTAVAVASDGTLSVDGVPLAKIGVFLPADEKTMMREAGVRFSTNEEISTVSDAVILQGFLEQSNVNPISEISRMIEVQRAYERGQAFLDREDERIRSVLRTLGS